MPNSVKVFQSTDSGAPVLSGTAGTLIALLDACLTAGYGTVTIDTLVVASDVATVTDSSGHGFTAIGNVGPVIRIAGATPAGLNGDWRITYVSATQFTFATAGISDQTASGTITAVRAPAGFSKVFSGTNLAAYRSDDVTGTRLYLRVDDTPAQFPTLIMYETMSDVNTGTGASSIMYLGKSSAANSTARAWRLYANSNIFYLFVHNGTTSGYWEGNLIFGDIAPYKSNDIFHCMLRSNTSAALDFNSAIMTKTLYITRSYSQSGSAVIGRFWSHGIGTSIGSNTQTYPALADISFHAWPVEVWEGSTIARGMLPGLWNPIHAATALTDLTLITNVPQLTNRTLVVQQMYDNGGGFSAMDITGPWR